MAADKVGGGWWVAQQRVGGWSWIGFEKGVGGVGVDWECWQVECGGLRGRVYLRGWFMRYIA